MSDLLFNNTIRNFIKFCNESDVKMIMVGGGAVNFHGYQRHSADIDFWIDTSDENLDNLKKALHQLGYIFEQFPAEVKEKLQNISLKISPYIEIELITQFNFGKTFEDAFSDSKFTEIDGVSFYKYHVLSYEDLIESKIKSSRPKDLLDISELKRINAR